MSCICQVFRTTATQSVPPSRLSLFLYNALDSGSYGGSDAPRKWNTSSRSRSALLTPRDTFPPPITTHALCRPSMQGNVSIRDLPVSEIKQIAVRPPRSLNHDDSFNYVTAASFAPFPSARDIVSS